MWPLNSHALKHAFSQFLYSWKSEMYNAWMSTSYKQTPKKTSEMQSGSGHL